MSKLQLSLTFVRTISKELGLPHITILSFFHGDGVAVVVVMEMMAMVVVEVVMVVMMMVMVLVAVVMEMMVMVMAMLLFFFLRNQHVPDVYCLRPVHILADRTE